MTPVTVKGAHMRLTLSETRAEPTVSRLDPIIEWMQAHPWKTLIVIFPGIALFVGFWEGSL